VSACATALCSVSGATTYTSPIDFNVFDNILIPGEDIPSSLVTSIVAFYSLTKPQL